MRKISLLFLSCIFLFASNYQGRIVWIKNNTLGIKNNQKQILIIATLNDTKIRNYQCGTFADKIQNSTKNLKIGNWVKIKGEIHNNIIIAKEIISNCNDDKFLSH